MSQDIVDKPWLSAQDIAREIGVHVETVRRWLRVQAIPAIKFGKGQWRVHRQDLEAWLSDQAYSFNKTSLKQ